MKTNLLLMLTTALLAGACADSGESTTVTPQPLTVTTVRNLPADPSTGNDPQTGRALGTTGRYTLYSLRENRQIANADSATDRWDIGFQSTNIIVNGGAIRSGRGGVHIHTGLFDELTAVPTGATFAVDASASALAIPARSGQGWYNYNRELNLVTPIPGRVLVIRTGDGRQYAKLEVLSYYENAPSPVNPERDRGRFFTFRFALQPDGSQQFR